MLTEREHQLNEVLRLVAKSLDISPSDYEQAKQSYGAVGRCLENGYQDGAYPGSIAKPEIYPQGSIRLGTVVKPLRDCEGSAYDVDLVCELQYRETQSTQLGPQAVKLMVGKRLQSDGVYSRMLDDEGKRCWTVEYAEKDGVGFHIDVLPCVPDRGQGAEITRVNPGNPDTRDEFTRTTIALTHKDDRRPPQYEWRSGNPHGYANWFYERNTTFAQFAVRQKQIILETARSPRGMQPLYESVQSVPDQLVRTPLQRAIQILKRHRDIRFGNDPPSDRVWSPRYKPISMIITTLSARLYEGENDVLIALQNIVNRLSQYASLVENRFALLHEAVAQRELIRRRDDGTWEIQNPVNPAENFADRWHEDEHARAKAFFGWVRVVKDDLDATLRMPNKDGLIQLLGERLGERVINEAWEKFEKRTPKTVPVGSLASFIMGLPSKFNVEHRLPPQWPVQIVNDVRVVGHYKQDGRWIRFESDGTPLPKHVDLRFKAKTNTLRPYTVHWQVVNTGGEAERAGCLRGDFYPGLREEEGRDHEESTLYSGMHWVECFIVKNGSCVARSGEFVVNIR